VEDDRAGKAGDEERPTGSSEIASSETPAPTPTVRPSAPPSLPVVRPSAPPPPAAPPPNHRLLFAALWVIAQAILVVTADRRIDGAFGFRMFSESASIKVALYREVEGPTGTKTRTHVDGGVWTAHGADGILRRWTWYDRVPSPFWLFDQEMHASYGAGTQLGRLQAALDDVANHIPDDAETSRLLLQVTVRRNGREPVIHQLTSRERTAEVAWTHRRETESH
jgi:hypothetical protein